MMQPMSPPLFFSFAIKSVEPKIAFMTAIRTFTVDALTVKVYANTNELAGAAAREAQTHLQETLASSPRGEAAVILATGNSQLTFLNAWVALGGLDWSKLSLFHLDEYLGMPADHPASFRRYLRERVELKVRPKVFHYVEGDALQPLDACDAYANLLRQQPIALCCLGIGENGHLAFNDPPVADFNDRRWVKIVKLDEACRRQQSGEGHFPDVQSVPQYALTLTIPALCAAKKMLCIVPEKRKAQAVRATLYGPIERSCPASYLRTQPQATLLLDAESASEISG